MAHMLSMNNGKVELAYAFETPWHGLGTQVEGLQTAGDMLEKAGLLWTVSTQPIFTSGAGQVLEVVPGMVAIRRDDKAITFGIASERYHPIQNAQAGDVVQALMGGGANVEVAGALDEGQRCWILAQTGDTFEVVPGDEVKPYLLLAWGHDGKHGLAGKTTMTRVVCNNTLTAVLGAKWSTAADFYVKHSANASIRIDEALKALGLAKKQGAETADAYRLLAATKLEAPSAYFGTAFPTPEIVLGDKAIDEKLDRWNAVQAQVLALYEGGKGSEIPGVAGTVWAGYNAVTEYIDHVYPVLKSGQVSARRQQSVAFGGYAEVKANALKAGLALAGVGA